MAKQLAKKLDYVFVDTGAMYRAIAYYFIEHTIDIIDENAVKNALANIELHFENNPDSGKSDIFLNGQNIEKQIRTMQISNMVSPIAAIAAVRTFAVAAQQEMGTHKGLVMDGRDVGTTVFPKAELKIFMTASVEIRVERRYKELLATYPEITKEEVKKNLEERDYIDSHRKISPLRQAVDARILDNTNLTMDEQLDIAYNWAIQLIKK